MNRNKEQKKLKIQNETNKMEKIKYMCNDVEDKMR